MCPVCGVWASDFEPYEEPPEVASTPDVTGWRCLNCSYTVDGEAQPTECPVCGVGPDRFTPLRAESADSSTTSFDGRIVIVGSGVAGVSAAEAIREHSSEAEIVMISREDEFPYYRLNLTRYLAGEIDEDALLMHSDEWYEQNGIRLLQGTDVLALHPQEARMDLAGGEDMSYASLVLAMGSHAFVPSFPGATLGGVFTLRTMADAVAIRNRIGTMGKCVCIGGGVLGLETAAALARQGADVSLLESHEWLMPRQLNRTAGELLAQSVAGMGIRLLRKARTVELVGEENITGIRLDDGTTVAADTVIIATGVRSNSFLARGAGLDVNSGITVDDRLETSVPGIYAAGDVAEHNGIMYGGWSASLAQGRIAGMNAVGAKAAFAGIPRSHTIKVLDTDLVSIGLFEPPDGSYRLVEEEANGCYSRFVFRDSHMRGCLLLGNGEAGAAANRAIEQGRDFSALLARACSVADVVSELKNEKVES